MSNYTKADFDISRLGSFYHPEKTIFRVFSPESKGVSLIIKGQAFKMHKNGMCYEIAIGGNLEGYNYCYKHITGVTFKDPFAYYSDENYSYILNPNRFINDKIEVKNKKATVIYETSVRDFSCDDSFPDNIRRKFLSFTIDNLKIHDYFVVGLDYLKHLGVSHIQLLPVFAFDLDKADYNWGYNPLAYNLVHPAYVVNQSNPYAHINELRKMVNCLHSNDMKVTLDVVFNHVYRAMKFDLAKMVRGNIFRVREDGKLANGAFCGNEIKSEDPFVREYIVEMVRRYIRLFDIDGIRMDLMGILDWQTVNEIREEALKLKSDFIIYGEGWNMGDVLPEENRASLKNADKLKGIAMFNDFFRETVVNTVVREHINEENLKLILSGNNNNLTFERSVNYVECHDNNTFFDRLMIDRSDDTLFINTNRSKLAMGLVMVARGIPFIHSGEEFLRTKKLVENSYNASEDINKIDWNRRVEYNPVCDYLKSLISIRNKYDFTAEVSYITHDSVLIYSIGKLKVYINFSCNGIIYPLSKKTTLIFDGYEECENEVKSISMEPYSLMISAD